MQIDSVVRAGDVVPLVRNITATFSAYVKYLHIVSYRSINTTIQPVVFRVA